MDDFNSIIAQLEGSHIASSWSSLLDLYNEIDQYAAQFTQKTGVSCPTGCGTCCEHFFPDITELEASLIGAYLVFIKKDEKLFQKLNTIEEPKRCPFYEKEDPFHCQIYPVRAMVCRMFASVPSRDKYGLAQFKRCKYNDKVGQQANLEHDFIVSKIPEIKTMVDFSSNFASIAMSISTQDLDIAVINAIEHLQFISAYLLTESTKGPFDRPDPLAS